MMFYLVSRYKNGAFPRILLLFLIIVFQLGSGGAALAEDPFLDLTELSLEQLLNVEVVSASRKIQKLSETDAAVFVITQDVLKRSGATNIMEALRMVPGIQVARIDANKWAISARGFNGRFSNKLLVLMDGRSIYSPLFSGVFWDIQDTLLEDVERIEVIRGPGATLWGANAVNGVINIITKHTRDTQGSFFMAGAGTEERGFGAVRHGGKFAQDIYYRLFAKYFDRDGGEYFTGGDAEDDCDAFRAGFRLDWRESLTLQGDVFSGDGGGEISVPSPTWPYAQIEKDPIDNGGGHLLGKWEHMLSNGSELAFQIYYDRAEYDISYVNTTVDTVDVEFNHRFLLGDRQEIAWGLGYRYIRDEMAVTSTIVRLIPESSEDQLLSGYVQSEIQLIHERLRFTLGSKFENNDYSGFEIQPSARLLWTPEKSYSLWASVSRAVRTPARVDHDVQFDRMILPAGTFHPLFPGPGVVRAFGSSDYDAEDLLAFELGLRVQPADNLFLDITVFYNEYDKMRTTDAEMPYIDMSTGMPFMVVPTIMGNEMEGDSYGVEIAADWIISTNWKLKTAYSYIKISLDTNFQSGENSPDKVEEGSTPRNQLSLMSSMSLPGNLDLDIWARYVDNLSFLDVPSYITADIRLGWHITDQIELSVTGRNLLDPSHPEYIPQFLTTIPTEIERSIYGKIAIHF